MSPSLGCEEAAWCEVTGSGPGPALDPGSDLGPLPSSEHGRLLVKNGRTLQPLYPGISRRSWGLNSDCPSPRL